MPRLNKWPASALSPRLIRAGAIPTVATLKLIDDDASARLVATYMAAIAVTEIIFIDVMCGSTSHMKTAALRLINALPWSEPLYVSSNLPPYAH